jgi:peptidoglycan/xylan/chitin deacetylase (PgdA/CDA1 family)
MGKPILMYHRVCADEDAPRSPYVVTASVFARQLEWLAARGYRGVSAEAIASPAHRSERVVAITLDDGYLDNYTVAFPLLLEHGFTATIFAVADLDRRANFWDVTGPMAGAPLLQPKHLREMSERGISFGSHGDSHAPLVALDDAAVLAELTRSRDVLEQVLGRRVDTFAYPYGTVDGRSKALVARAGYRCAFAVNSGPLRADADLLEIRRVLVGDVASDLYMSAKVEGAERRLRSRFS